VSIGEALTPKATPLHLSCEVHSFWKGTSPGCVYLSTFPSWHAVQYLKHSWSLARPFKPPTSSFLRAGEASKLFVTYRPFLFIVSGFHATHLLFQAPTYRHSCHSVAGTCSWLIFCNRYNELAWWHALSKHHSLQSGLAEAPIKTNLAIAWCYMQILRPHLLFLKVVIIMIAELHAQQWPGIVAQT
jgi:hypothetical protein